MGALAMEYSFLEMSDEALLEGCGLPIEGGAAIALFSTGYDVEEDEIVSFSLADANGAVLFDETVKPHNREGWAACDASGRIGPEDVEGAVALYEREDEIMELLDGVPYVVCVHVDFAKAMLDRSWISLPQTREIDLGELFRLSHGTSDRPGEPATAVSLEGISSYYGVPYDGTSTAAIARSTMDCYKAIVSEFREKRDAKGAAYWEERERRFSEAAAADGASSAAARMRERRMNQMNALLWVAGGLIFISLIIQLYQRGGDVGLMVVAGAAAVFSFLRAAANWNKK